MAKYPPDNCSECKGVLIFTQRYDEKKLEGLINRLYKCARCGALAGSVTGYALCKIKGVIAKDSVVNACYVCEYYKDGEQCSNLLRKLTIDDIEIKQIGSNKFEIILSRR